MDNTDLTVVNAAIELVERKELPSESNDEYAVIPFAGLASVGAGISSMIPWFRRVKETVMVSMPDNIYAAYDSAGAAKKLRYVFKGTTDFMGSDVVNGVTSQTHFKQVGELAGKKITQLPFDPTLMFMAAALVSIDKKLSDIKDIQLKIFDFLESDKRAELESSLSFLTELLSAYRFNWENKTYLANAHLKTQDIKQSAEHNMLFYRNRIISEYSKKSFLQTGSALKSKMKQVQSDFNNYQLAIYLFSFASFVEVLMLANFSEDYLCSVSQQIEQYHIRYMEDYTGCYNALEQAFKKSLPGVILGGVASASGKVGKAVARIPVISKTQIDENLIASEDSLKSFSEKSITGAMMSLTGSKDSMVSPFIGLIKKLNLLHNQPSEFFFDEEKVYLKIE